MISVREPSTEAAETTAKMKELAPRLRHVGGANVVFASGSEKLAAAPSTGGAFGEVSP
jgi:hypothetical protein